MYSRRGESQNISDKNSDPIKAELKLEAEAICQMDCLEELRDYSQGAKHEIETKLEKKAESCKVLKKKTDPTWCLISYDGVGEE